MARRWSLARASPTGLSWGSRALRARLRWDGCGQRGHMLCCNSMVVFWTASGELENIERDRGRSLVASHPCACRLAATAHPGTRSTWYRIRIKQGVLGMVSGASIFGNSLRFPSGPEYVLIEIYIHSACCLNYALKRKTHARARPTTETVPRMTFHKSAHDVPFDLHSLRSACRPSGFTV